MEARGSIAVTKSWLARMAAGTLAVGAFMVWAGVAQAQPAITSTADLKRACEASPTNEVYLGSDVKIDSGVAHGGAYNPAYERVTTGCTVELAPGTKFETDSVAMSFDGPFRVEGAGKGSAIFTRSAWKAPSMAFDLDDAPDSEFRTSASRLDATAGNLDVLTGQDGDVQLQYMSGVVYALKASGNVNISGGDRTFLDVYQTSVLSSGRLNVVMKGNDATLKLGGRPSLVGTTGLSINLGGGAPTLSTEAADFYSNSGPVNISSPGNNALVELQDSRLFGRGTVAVRLLGAETSIKSAATRFQSDTGNVELRAGGPGASTGTVELARADVRAAGRVIVLGSPDAQNGGVKAASGTSLRAGTELLLRTGPAGTTEAKDLSIWAQTAIRILAGPGGTCVAQNNSYIAPASAARQICQQ